MCWMCICVRVCLHAGVHVKKKQKRRYLFTATMYESLGHWNKEEADNDTLAQVYNAVCMQG